MYQGNNKCLALLRHAYDDYHGFVVTVKEPNGDTYSKCYKMTEYLKAWRYFEESKFKYHRDTEIEIANIYVK